MAETHKKFKFKSNYYPLDEKVQKALTIIGKGVHESDGEAGWQVLRNKLKDVVDSVSFLSKRHPPHFFLAKQNLGIEQVPFNVARWASSLNHVQVLANEMSGKILWWGILKHIPL